MPLNSTQALSPRAAANVAPALEATRTFWNANPCDGHADVEGRMAFRYGKEPWLPHVLERVARFNAVLEVGCGQGTDALYCCRRLDRKGSYVGVDLSPQSVASARRSLESTRHTLRVVPEFHVDNAEQLQLPANSFDCVYSMGVLHHTHDTQQAIDEVHRVLRPGGTAMIALYRSVSPKVFLAHAIRAVSRGLDRVTGQNRLLYTLAGRLGSDHALGTMLLECVGVPILRSYTRGQLHRLFGRFTDIRVEPLGIGLPLGPLRRLDEGPHPLGALWLIEARKP